MKCDITQKNIYIQHSTDVGNFSTAYFFHPSYETTLMNATRQVKKKRGRKETKCQLYLLGKHRDFTRWPVN